jgi:hypothetical protein
MGYAVQDLRDLLALARLLRRVAQEEAYDAHCDLFLETAGALEARAFRMAIYGGDAGRDLSESELHAPVNLLV